MTAGDFAELERGTQIVDHLAAKLAAVDGLVWNEQCVGEQPDGDAGDCDSNTCIAAHYENHDPDVARANYRRYARIALTHRATAKAALPAITHDGEAKLAAYREGVDLAPDGTAESLETCATMLEEWGPECFPANQHGQMHFARAMMDSTAAEIRAFLAAYRPAEHG